MKKILIIIPVYNDWKSLDKLLQDINKNIENYKNISFECFVVNDASTIDQPNLLRPKNIKSLKVLNMSKNQGHGRSYAFALKYINQHENFDNIILMDGDGEDRPVEIKSLVNQIINEPNCSVVAKRVKRSEGPFFQFLYRIHKLLTLIFTGKNINFGNYSCLTKNDVKILSSKVSLWSSYSGTFKKNIKQFNEVNSDRGLRYFGPSKMSFFKLLVHSFSIIAVFKYQVFFRSLIILIILFSLNSYYYLITNFLISVMVLFNCIIFSVSLRENKKAFDNCQKNLKNVKQITQ